MTNPTMYDIIIVGGGISGLHCAYRLQDKNKICVLEKEDCLGGRIRSVNFHGTTIEAGAGRFNQHHKLYKELLDELNIETTSTLGVLSFFDKDTYNNGIDPFKTLNPVFEAAKKEKIETLQSYAFIDYARTILSKEEISLVISSFGYYEQLIKMNAYDALKLFEKGMHTKNKFYIVKGGMSQVITELHKRITENCSIKCGKEVESIEYEDGIFSVVANGKTYKSKTCICAIPKFAMEKIPFFKPLKPIMDAIGIKILCRMYAMFEKNDIWFKTLPKCTVNNEIRYVIPIDREKGIIMISYTDSKYAQYWATMSQSKIIPTIQSKLKESLHIDIPKPKHLRAFYWETGTAYWKPNYDSRELWRKMRQPYENMPFYTCGENFSQTQGWIEGAIESSWNVIKFIS